MAVDEEEAGFEEFFVGDARLDAVDAGVDGARDGAGVGRFTEERPGFERLAEFDFEIFGLGFCVLWRGAAIIILVGIC